MQVRPVSTTPFVAQTQTLPAADSPQVVHVVLRALPRPPLSERMHHGLTLGSAQQAPQTAHPVPVEQDRGSAARLRELARRGVWRQLENLLAEVEAQLPEEQQEEWQQWAEEWGQSTQARESGRLFLLGTLFCRILAPGLNMHVEAEDRLKAERLIKKLSTLVQRLLPPGRLVEDFLRMCQQSWLHYLKGLQAAARQNAPLGQILEQISTLPLSAMRQQQLDQWIEGLLSIPPENTDMQLMHCAVLILRYLRPLLGEIREHALKVLLAKIEEDVCRWMESRLSEGESIEAFLQQAREGLIEEAVTRVHLQQIDEAASEALRELEGRAHSLQQQMQANRNQVTQALTEVQAQRHGMLSTEMRIEQVASTLQQTEGNLHTQLATLVVHAQQEESVQLRFNNQVSQLEQEASRL